MTRGPLSRLRRLETADQTPSLVVTWRHEHEPEHQALDRRRAANPGNEVSANDLVVVVRRFMTPTKEHGAALDV